MVDGFTESIRGEKVIIFSIERKAYEGMKKPRVSDDPPAMEVDGGGLMRG